MSRPLLAGGALLRLTAFAGTSEEADTARGHLHDRRLREELLVDADWLAGRLEDPEGVVLHVGAERGEYEQGLLPGARFLSVRAIATERGENLNELPPVAHLDSVFEAAGISATRPGCTAPRFMDWSRRAELPVER